MHIHTIQPLYTPAHMCAHTLYTMCKHVLRTAPAAQMTTVEPDPDDLTPWGQHYGTTRQKRGARIAQMQAAVEEGRVNLNTQKPRYYKTRSQRPYVGALVRPDDWRTAAPGPPKYTVRRRPNGTLVCTCPDFVQLSTGARETSMDPGDRGHTWCKHIWATGMWKSAPGHVRNTWFPVDQRVRDIQTNVYGTVVTLRDWRVLVQWDVQQQYGHGGAFSMEYVHTDNLERLDANGVVIRDFEVTRRSMRDADAWYTQL